MVKLASLYGLLTATSKVTCAGDLRPEPVETWHREIRALRNATALWDAIRGKDEAALRRTLPQHQAAKGKELLGMARERLARQITEQIAGGRLELVVPEDGGPFALRQRPGRLLEAICSSSPARSPA